MGKSDKKKKKRFNEMKSIVTEAKNNKWKTSVDNKIITVNSIEEFIKDIVSRKLKYEEAKNRYKAIIDNYIKNEIRQLFYSLYWSKELTKTIYNNLINTF